MRRGQPPVAIPLHAVKPIRLRLPRRGRLRRARPWRSFGSNLKVFAVVLLAGALGAALIAGLVHLAGPMAMAIGIPIVVVVALTHEHWSWRRNALRIARLRRRRRKVRPRAVPPVHPAWRLGSRAAASLAGLALALGWNALVWFPPAFTAGALLWVDHHRRSQRSKLVLVPSRRREREHERTAQVDETYRCSRLITQIVVAAIAAGVCYVFWQCVIAILWPNPFHPFF